VPGWRAAAYGLELSGDFELRGLSQTGAAPTPGRPGVELQLVGSLPPAEGASRISGSPDGLMIQADPGGGHRVTGAGLGAALIAPGAATVALEPPGADGWMWNRWVLSQVLPFVAALHGIELLHAGGVVQHGSALVVVGPSGAGKSTLVAALVERGAAFLADDVVAVEPRGAEVVAHPGPGLLVLDTGRPIAPAAPAELGTVCWLEPAAQSGLQTMAEPDPRALLSNVYERVRRDPSRLEHQLSLLAQLAGQARFIRLRRGPDTDPERLAGRLIDCLRTG
jgi:hypothetical protein